MDDVDRVLRDAVTAAGLTGAVAIAATSRGVIHSAAIGERATGEAMRLDSVARIASMTKAITSVLALRLVERGMLTLDDPICDVLPELAAPMVFERFGIDGRPILTPATVPITLRHLLTHTAGYGYDTWNQPLGHLQASLGLPRIPSSSDELRRVPLLFEPGTHWNYGINTDIVGRACEVVTGKGLDVLVREEITGPLGMNDTMFIPGPEQEARRITVRQRQADGSMERLVLGVAETMPFMAGGGGLHSTGADYIRFLQAVLRREVLGTAMFAELVRPQSADVVPMISAKPEMSHDVVLYPEMALKWSLGFLVNMKATREGRSAESLAWAGFFNTYYWIDLERDVCGLFVAQVLPFADPGAYLAFLSYEKAVSVLL